MFFSFKYRSTYLRPFNNNTPKQYKCRTQKIVRIWCGFVFVEKAWVETKKLQQTWMNEWWITYVVCLTYRWLTLFHRVLSEQTCLHILKISGLDLGCKLIPQSPPENKKEEKWILNTTKRMKWNVIKIQLCLVFFCFILFVHNCMVIFESRVY